MKHSAILSLLSAAFVFLPGIVAAADEPEVVYAKFHRAAMAGDLEEMLKYGPAQRRAEMQGLTDAHKAAALKMVQLMMPRAFTLQRKTVFPTGRATLIVSGPLEEAGRDMETVYGTIRMVNESGEWKVAETGWSSDKPAMLSSPKPAAPAKAAPAAGSMSSGPPARKLGEAKQECVYKPVMTAEDMQRCR